MTDDERHQDLHEEAKHIVAHMLLDLAIFSSSRCPYCTLTEIAVEVMAATLGAELDLDQRKQMANKLMRRAYKRSHVLQAQVERQGATLQ